VTEITIPEKISFFFAANSLECPWKNHLIFSTEYLIHFSVLPVARR